MTQKMMMKMAWLNLNQRRTRRYAFNIHTWTHSLTLACCLLNLCVVFTYDVIIIISLRCILILGAFFQESNWHDEQVTRWFDGLISKDIEITNEIYSVQGVEFDRQVRLFAKSKSVNLCTCCAFKFWSIVTHTLS